MKILISWISYVNDFIEGGVNKSGPTYNFYSYHYKGYEKHILLATKDSETKMDFLKCALIKDFPRNIIEPYLIDIEDLGNLIEVKSKVEAILLAHNMDEIDIFFSPGASMMQLSWYICHTTLGLKTRLLQLRRPEHSKNKTKPEIINIEVKRSSVPVSAMLKQYSIDQTLKDKDYLIFDSIHGVYEKAYKVAQSENVTAVIYGSSGTGKEHLARYIHDNSGRSGKPYKAVNCSVFTDQLLESRLFGYKKGSFTGAEKDHIGIFEQANGGTVFLDEIGDISPYMQQALLRVLQEKEITPLNDESKKINVRFLAATNKNLVKLCEEGKFRWDLYYRITVVELQLPDLNSCSAKEKTKLINFFLDKKKSFFKKQKALKLCPEVEKLLLEYHYPGNIRELENLIDNFYVFSDQIVTKTDLPEKLINVKSQSPLLLESAEKQHIFSVLNYLKGNQKQTAKSLGISVNTLKSKIKKYMIEV